MEESDPDPRLQTVPRGGLGRMGHSWRWGCWVQGRLAEFPGAGAGKGEDSGEMRRNFQPL